jgi:hypothetical protein
MRLRTTRGPMPKDLPTNFGPYKITPKYKYLGNVISNRGLITPHLSLLKLRSGIMTNKLQKLGNRALDTSTCIEVFGSYIRPILQVPMPALPFSAPSTITNFCTLYLCTLKRCAGVVKNATIPEFLAALNQTHPWDHIHRAYSKANEKLSSIGLSTRPLNTSTPSMIKAFATLSKCDSPPLVPHLTKHLLKIPALTAYPHRNKSKRLNNLSKLPSFA